MTIIVATGDSARAQAAAMVALAAAALGESVQMFFHADAVQALANGEGPLIGEALSAGVRIIACQTGLADHGLEFTALPDGCESGGLVSVLADASGDRLLSF